MKKTYEKPIIMVVKIDNRQHLLQSSVPVDITRCQARCDIFHYLPVPNVAAAALLANLKLVAAVEAGGLDYVCLAGLQQLCLML